MLGMLAAVLLILAPMLAPLVDLIERPGAWDVWSEWDRLLPLIGNTLLVMAGSAVLALVLGGIAAFLIVRTDVPGRRAWALLLAVGLFIPLPLLTCGWYLLAQFADWGLPALWPAWQRILGAAWLHGLLGVPWSALVIGLGLAWIEPELEETARLEGPWSAVLWRVTWPRCRPFVALAALLVAWTTWHEIVVTDFFKVNTLAEEVFLRLTAGGDEPAAATASALPWCILFALFCWRALRTWRRDCPPRWPNNRRLLPISLRRYRWNGAAWLFLAVAGVMFIPLVGLIAKAGIVYDAPHPPRWSTTMVIQQIAERVQVNGDMLLQSVTVALLTGALTAFTVLFLVWGTRRSPRAEAAVWATAAMLWAIPGPLLDLGLQQVIMTLVQAPGGQFWSAILYSHPSPLPNVWAAWLRFLPLAWAIIWPVARLIPPAWEELALLDGATAWSRFWTIYWPSLARPVLWLALAVAVLSLGEISASKMITTPGYVPLAHHIFQQLHAGLDGEVAALALTLMLPVLLGGLAATLWRPVRSR